MPNLKRSTPGNVLTLFDYIRLVKRIAFHLENENAGIVVFGSEITCLEGLTTNFIITSNSIEIFF